MPADHYYSPYISFYFILFHIKSLHILPSTSFGFHDFIHSFHLDNGNVFKVKNIANNDLIHRKIIKLGNPLNFGFLDESPCEAFMSEFPKKKREERIPWITIQS